MSGSKPCNHVGDPKKKQGNRKIKLNKPAGGKKTNCTLPARTLKHEIISCLLQNDVIYLFKAFIVVKYSNYVLY